MFCCLNTASNPVPGVAQCINQLTSMTLAPVGGSGATPSPHQAVTLAPTAAPGILSQLWGDGYNGVSLTSLLSGGFLNSLLYQLEFTFNQGGCTNTGQCYIQDNCAASGTYNIYPESAGGCTGAPLDPTTPCNNIVFCCMSSSSNPVAGVAQCATQFTTTATLKPTKLPTGAPFHLPTVQPTGAPVVTTAAPVGTTTAAPVGNPLCLPSPFTKKKACRRKLLMCAELKQPMKFAGKGCKLQHIREFDGGCQCLGYCGYKCITQCLKDPQCTWASDVTGCVNKITGVGGPINLC